jgi:hypothetical protein
LSGAQGRYAKRYFGQKKVTVSIRSARAKPTSARMKRWSSGNQPSKTSRAKIRGSVTAPTRPASAQ